jgi:hypothetical protein
LTRVSACDYIRSQMKTAALQLQLTSEQIKRVERCMAKVNADSRAAFGELALDLVMPLIESDEMVNFNGKLRLKSELAKEFAQAA